MRSLLLVASGLLAVAVLVGCGSAPASPSAQSPAPAATGTECAGLPTLAGPSPAPSFELTRDPELEAAFPSEIDGQPVTNLQSALLIETICLFGGQSGVDGLRSQAPAGFDLTDLFVASADTMVEGSTIRLTAFRRPGGNVGDLLESVRALTSVAGGDPDKFSGELTEASVGGKTVQVWTDPQGATSYLYAAGDTLFVLDDVSPSQADRILAAL